MKNYIVYQAHTNPILYYETLFSIYSLAGWEDVSKYCFIIYTDQTEIFKKYLSHFNVSYQALNKNLVDDWMGKHKFVHRVKIKMLQDVLSKYTGNFLYVDSDTYFTKAISDVFKQIQEGELFMHCFENLLYNIRMYKPLNGYSVKLNGENHIIPRDTPIWNAGALGFNNQASEIINQALDLTDTLYDYYQKHIIEQFSFSYLFNRKSSIQKAENHIFHYWFVKEFREYLKEIFTNPLNQKADRLISIVRAVNPTLFAEEKLKWRNHSGLHRAYKRLVGQDFKLPPLSTLLSQDQFLIE